MAAVVAALLLFLLLRMLLGALRLTHTRGTAARDPQFAEPAEVVTRPPDLDATGGSLQLADDPSSGWEQGEQTPVDKTADELVREAEAAD